MADQKQIDALPVQVKRFFEQPADTISFYSDFGQVMNTGNEVVIQFYETIPGIPTEKGNLENAKTRLRATITLSFSHAQNIGKLLTQQAKP